MLNGLNIPRPGEHVYMHGQKLNGLYKVVEAEYVHETEEFRFNATPVFSANDSREMPVNYIYRTALAHGGEWFYPRTPDADFNHQVSIVLPTAGRPVFLKLPEIPGMSTKELSGTVHWAALEGKDKYRFAVYLKRYLDLLTTLPIMIDDLVHIFWDNEKSEWYVIEFDGGHRQVGQHRVEVTFG